MKPTLKPFLPILALLALLFSQLACKTVTRALDPSTPEPVVVRVTATPQIIVVTAAPGPSPQATQDPVPAMSDDEISAGIQLALDLYAQAYTENDPKLLDEVVDQENKPFRRIVRSRFDSFQQSYLAGQIDFQNTLLGIQRREMGYVIAHFEDEGGWYADWPFRYTEGRWVLTEPGVEQIGEPVTVEGEYFNFITYPWNEDVNQQIMDMMSTAREEALAKLGKAPQDKATVRIVPIYGIDPYGSMGAIAWYSPGGGPDGNDLIHIYSPNSFAYSYYDPTLGWDGTLQTTLTHEFTHMVHNRSFNSAGRLADWMSEGLAEYVSQPEGSFGQACYAYRTDTYIPILDESGAVYKQDLMHMTQLDTDVGLGYSYSHALVTYVVKKHGGLDGFWKLADKLDSTGDFREAVQEAFGISFEEFDRLWQQWLKAEC